MTSFVGFLYMASIVLRYIAFICNLLKAFTMKECRILLNIFSSSTEMTMWFLSFSLLMWYIYWFVYFEPYLHLWDKSFVIMVCMILFWYYWIWFGTILFRIFECMLNREICLYCIFSFLIFSIRVMLVLCSKYFFWTVPSLCSPGLPWTPYKTQADHELAIFLSPLPKCWDCRHAQPHLALVEWVWKCSWNVSVLEEVEKYWY
jgi:hypothetical protein